MRQKWNGRFHVNLLKVFWFAGGMSLITSFLIIPGVFITGQIKTIFLEVKTFSSPKDYLVKDSLYVIDIRRRRNGASSAQRRKIKGWLVSDPLRRTKNITHHGAVPNHAFGDYVFEDSLHRRCCLPVQKSILVDYLVLYDSKNQFRSRKYGTYAGIWFLFSPIFIIGGYILYLKLMS